MIAKNVYVGTVFDNSGCNRLASKIIESGYPKIFAPGYCIHMADLAMKYVFKDEEIMSIVDNCRFVVIFVKSLCLAGLLYKKLCQLF